MSFLFQSGTLGTSLSCKNGVIFVMDRWVGVRNSNDVLKESEITKINSIEKQIVYQMSGSPKFSLESESKEFKYDGEHEILWYFRNGACDQSLENHCNPLGLHLGNSLSNFLSSLRSMERIEKVVTKIKRMNNSTNVFTCWFANFFNDSPEFLSLVPYIDLENGEYKPGAKANFHGADSLYSKNSYLQAFGKAELVEELKNGTNPHFDSLRKDQELMAILDDENLVPRSQMDMSEAVKLCCRFINSTRANQKQLPNFNQHNISLKVDVAHLSTNNGFVFLAKEIDSQSLEDQIVSGRTAPSSWAN